MRFNYELMQLHSRDLKELVNSMYGYLEEIENNNNELRNNGYWVGRSYQYYETQFAQVSAEFRTVYEKMLESINYLDTIIEQYSSLDRQIIMGIADILDIRGN